MRGELLRRTGDRQFLSLLTMSSDPHCCRQMWPVQGLKRGLRRRKKGRPASHTRLAGEHSRAGPGGHGGEVYTCPLDF